MEEVKKHCLLTFICLGMLHIFGCVRCLSIQGGRGSVDLYPWSMDGVGWAGLETLAECLGYERILIR